jgi:hypothetical protein
MAKGLMAPFAASSPAHVAWTATYARKNQPDVAIDFDVHYFVRTVDGKSKVFGWVSGDEQALLRKHGVI